MNEMTSATNNDTSIGITGINSASKSRRPDDTRVIVGDEQQCFTLHRRLKRIVKARGSLDLQEAAALREAQALGIWRRFGYASLVEYMEHEMGYTPRAALDRLRVANAIAELPKIADAIEQGDLSLCGARELIRVVTPETEATWLGAVVDMNVRQVEAVVSGHRPGDLPTDRPDPQLQLKVLRFDVRPDVAATLRQAQRIMEQERGHRLDDSELIEALARNVLDQRAANTTATVTAATATATSTMVTASNSAADAASVATLGTPSPSHARDHAPYRVAVTVCTECKRGWQHGGGTVVEMSVPAIDRALCDGEHIGDVHGATVRASETISKTTRRKVHHRDREMCQVPGCRASHNLDIHHIKHRAQGGGNELANLVTLREGHHLAHHDGSLTIRAQNGTIEIKREGRNNFTRAARAIETAAELRRRGFERDEIRVAMEQTKTHVGVQDLSAEQWLAIALQHCPSYSATG